MSETLVEEVKPEIKPEEQRVPLSRFKEATSKLKEEIDDLKQQLSSINKPKEEVHVSRETLRKAVDDGQITQDQADEFWDKQRERELEKKFQTQLDSKLGELKKETSTATAVSGLAQKIDQYVDLIPDLKTEGSKDREKISQKYMELVEEFGLPPEGSAEDLRLQVVALKTVYGSLEQLKGRVKEKSSRQTVEDVGSDPPDPKPDKLKLDSRQKKYYQRQIDNGIYKSWDDVEKELKFKRA